MRIRRIGHNVAIAGLFGLSFLGIQPSQAATKPVAPKVADCYLLVTSELGSLVSTKSPISCSKTHNAETFKVFKWKKATNPATLTEIERRAEIESICKPVDKFDDFFNSWSYKIPTASQWKSGTRIVRCDLNVTNFESETVTYKSWRGKKLILT